MQSLALDLYEAALRDGDPSFELARLRSRGFRRGRFRYWRNESEASLVVTSYELAGPADATLYRDDARHHLEAQAVRVRDVAGGFVATAGDSDGFVAHVVSVCAGAWHVLVVLDAASGLGEGAAVTVADFHRRPLL